MKKEDYQKNCDKLKEKLPQIVEFFVMVYGEEYRNQIEERLKSTVFLFFDNDIAFDRGVEDYNLSVIHENKIIDLEEIYSDMVIDKSIKNFEGFAFASARLDNLDRVANACVLAPIEKLTDQVLFHELNHIIQSDVKFLNKNNESRLMTRSGLKRDYYDIDLENLTAIRKVSEREESDLSLYNGLNEVFTEWTTLKVLDKAIRSGFRLGEKKNEEAVYAVTFPIMGQFIDGMIEAMKETFMKGNKKELLKFLSTKELEKLCEALNMLIEFEYSHADEMLKKLQYRKLNINDLLKMPSEKIPLDLRSYANMFLNLKNIVDEIENENSLE